MKKFLVMTVVVVLSLSFFAVGCDRTDINSQFSSDTSTPTNQSYENENTQQIEDVSSKAQIVTGTYVCEYEDYIFYRNTNDNGSLYRYNTKDDSCIKLFDENYNAFLHSISVYDNYVYFVTRVESDKTPALYRVSIDGGKAERLFDNVGDDYVITENAIYYTDYSNNNDIFALHKYNCIDNIDVLLDTAEYGHFNLIDGKIYCRKINQAYNEFLFVEFDLTTEKAEIIAETDVQYAVTAKNGKIIYFTDSEKLLAYNTATKELKTLAEGYGRIWGVRAASDELIYFTAVKDFDYENEKIYQYKEGKVSEYTEEQYEKISSMELIDGKPVFFSSSSTGGNKILGDDRLNVVVEG